MITSSVKALNNTKAKVARLEHALAKELASLPSAYGFNSLNEFVAAIKIAGGKRPAGRPKKYAAPKVRRRAKITDAVRVKVKLLVKAGKTGSSIAKTLGISLPSVQNIKKAFGLVKSSRKGPLKAKARRSPAKLKTIPKAKKKHVSIKKAPVRAPKPGPVAGEPVPASTAAV